MRCWPSVMRSNRTVPRRSASSSLVSASSAIASATAAATLRRPAWCRRHQAGRRRVAAAVAEAIAELALTRLLLADRLGTVRFERITEGQQRIVVVLQPRRQRSGHRRRIIAGRLLTHGQRAVQRIEPRRHLL